MDENKVSTDNRGWKNGKSRKHTPETKQQIIKIRNNLKKEDSYFSGSEAVKQNYENQTGEKVLKSYLATTSVWKSGA
ncbi:MAG: hypothetical protein EF812_04680 [Methanosarcinales archaeon]|nr:MAG: hypothetical protein EF812_04680 [Methanosarcinales archaeon]